MLRVLRWYNVLALFLAQAAVAWVVFAAGNGWLVLTDAKLGAILISSACTVAAAFLINAFYDKDKDLINKPQQVIMGRLMRQGPLLNVYLLLVVIALVLGTLASWRIGFFFLGFNGLCWFYSHKLQKLPWLREFSASWLTLAPLLAVWLHYGSWHWGFAYYLLGLWLLLFTRELWKDLTGHQGNIVFGYRTIAVQTGQGWLRQNLPLIQVVVVLGMLLWSRWQGFEFDFYYTTALAMALVCLLLSVGIAWSKASPKLDAGFKLAVTAYVLALLLHGGGLL
ncbi:MAG: UbiA family prenyltransferase [Bacteroidia bacterium]